MNILGIETSCDDTGISIINCKAKSEKRKAIFKVLSSVVSSQTKIHAQYGGVYPMLAKREHEKNLPIVYKAALKKAFGQKDLRLDLIAVTNGPGLEPCLWQGINFAKKLSKQLKIPAIPINHIEAHIFANFISKAKGEKRKAKMFPVIALIVSGGHTQLVLIKKFGKYKILGETLDDAVGECFDKTARVLGLSYPGGPAIEACASKAKNRGPSPVSLPRPMINQKNYNFSFSGLKTAVLYHYQSQSPKIQKSPEYVRAMAHEIQNAAIDVLLAKTFKAAQEYQVKSIILGGGVTANSQLRKRFKQQAKKSKIKLFVPDKKYSTDNAVMVAITGYFNWLKTRGKIPKSIEAKANLRLK